jgi:hypothetical protein
VRGVAVLEPESEEPEDVLLNMSVGVFLVLARGAPQVNRPHEPVDGGHEIGGAPPRAAGLRARRRPSYTPPASPHTSAYVRQHTSAYSIECVRIREHTYKAAALVVRDEVEVEERPVMPCLVPLLRQRLYF